MLKVIIIIKSDNAPTQYKNKFAFSFNFSNKYNVRIIRICGAAGPGKGLIDAMPSFGVKAILKRNITSHDCWVESSNSICEYPSSRCDGRMSYTNLGPRSIDEKRRNKEGHKNKGCMSQQIFEYVPNCKTVHNSEYLCEYGECINGNVSSCLKEAIELDETVEQVNVESNTEIEEKNDCELDEDKDQANHIYEFTAIPSFVAVIAFSINEPVYIIKFTEKCRATPMMYYTYGDRILKGELYLRGNYLKVVRSKNMLLKKFKILNYEVLIPPDEVFEIFVEVADDLTMRCRSYLA